jgi:hypothetical protein
MNALLLLTYGSVILCEGELGGNWEKIQKFIVGVETDTSVRTGVAMAVLVFSLPPDESMNFTVYVLYSALIIFRHSQNCEK